ncbi:MAG: hypothetical protein KDK33_13480 [Leptospiraceae bacterium]|nr:hypothetical protein [Leptospiraceae bacterium]
MNLEALAKKYGGRLQYALNPVKGKLEPRMFKSKDWVRLFRAGISKSLKMIDEAEETDSFLEYYKEDNGLVGVSHLMFSLD